ncbi:MAG TPA: ribonuclease R [Casimicrobiaceae bacterium]|nr:ribonuclease R [Casimicrobiaceae bacterium]
MSKKTSTKKSTTASQAALRRVATRTGEAKIPSRDHVLNFLREAGAPMRPEDLSAALGVSSRASGESFSALLAAMQRDGQLLIDRRGRLCVVAKLDLVTGTVQGHPDGYGFVVPDDGSADLFLSASEMRKTLHGDRVTARLIGVDRRGRPEGAIVDVLVRANQEVVGRFYEERGVCFVVAENRRINQDILIPLEARGEARPGQVVVVSLVAQPTARGEAVGRVVQVLGAYTDPGMEIEIALRKHALPHEFSAGAKRHAARLAPELRESDRKDRTDLTALPLVTIDGETAKDFDDAVYCERADNGFRLVVAIADVSHYVRDGQALDHDARERGTSVYFPRRVIPMLPEALSNELCSLKPAVDRLCMACDMSIDARGRIRRYRFYPAVMRSRARLTYTEVWDRLSRPASVVTAEAKALLPRLQVLHDLYRTLAAARAQRGAIDFDTPELVLQFDAQGKISAVVPELRNDAHKLIEECMLAANVCAAAYLMENRHPALFRVHEGPTPEKLEALREFLGGCGLALTGGDRPGPADYAKLLRAVRERPDFNLLQTVLLRSLQQAVYSPANLGHFGLGYEAYTHFTSPIRRYPDLLIHRCIKACLAASQYRPNGSSWTELGVHCSLTERRADEATRDVENWLKCYFMRDRVGETFTGTVSGVTHFGLFVTLDGLNVDGLLHVTDLGDDYFHFDAIHHRLAGERTGRTFRLADRLTVRLARVDLEQTRMDFALAGESERHGVARARSPRRKK